jgi:hypothetical protein
MGRKKQSKDLIDQLLSHIDFQGFTQDEVAGQNALDKTPRAGRAEEYNGT